MPNLGPNVQTTQNVANVQGVFDSSGKNLIYATDANGHQYSFNSLGTISSLAVLQANYQAANYQGYTAFPLDQGAQWVSDGTQWGPSTFPSAAQNVALTQPASGQYAPGGTIFTLATSPGSTCVTAPNASILYVQGTGQSAPAHQIAQICWYNNQLTGANYQDIANEAKWNASATSQPSYVQMYEANMNGNLGSVGRWTALNAHLAANVGTMLYVVGVNISLDANLSGSISNAIRGMDFNIQNSGATHVTVPEVTAINFPDLSAQNVTSRHIINGADAGALMTTAGPEVWSTSYAVSASPSSGSTVTIPANTQKAFIYNSAIAALTVALPANPVLGQEQDIIIAAAVTVLTMTNPNSYGMLGKPTVIALPGDGTYYSLKMKFVNVSGTPYWVMFGK